MSIMEGKKIVSALEAFNGNRIIRSDATSLLSVALRAGGIQKRHIDKLHDVLKREVAAIPTNFGLVRPRNFGGCEFISYGHMVVNKDAQGGLLYDQYTPNIVSYAIIKSDYTRRHTLLPISFNSQHTAFRFIQRTSRVLDYQSDEFADSLAFATLAMQALSRKPQPAAPIPMFVPHKQGLFMGFAEAMPEDTYIIHSEHTKRRGKRVEVKNFDTSNARIQPFIPTSRTVINTFLSKDDMNPQKFALWEKLYTLMSEPELDITFARALVCHTTGTYMVTPEHVKELEKLQDIFIEAMASPEWTRVASSAQKNGHIPTHSYADRLRHSQCGTDLTYRVAP